MKLKDLALIIEGFLIGDPGLEVSGVASLWEAEEGQIAFLLHKRYLKDVPSCRASALIASRDIEVSFRALIRVSNPQMAFAQVLDLFNPPDRASGDIGEPVHSGEGVRLAPNVRLFPFVYLSDGVEIGEGSIIYPFTFLGNRVKMGRNVLLYPNVSIYDDVEIGNDVIIHSGAVIGSDGFGFVGQVNGSYRKIRHIGKVVIEDGVEIGANVCIDRANLGRTVIGRGVKFDNLSHVAHNVLIGENTLVVAQTGISGSCEIGRNVILTGQVGIIDHVKIGDNAIVTPQSGVTEDVPPGAVVSGSTARPHAVWRRVQVSLPRLPELLKTVKKLEKRMEELEEKIGRGER